MLRIYCIYFDKRPIWQSNCILPIQAGRARTHFDLGIPSDDTGTNISSENVRYGEMTAWFWVWKNALPAIPSLSYVGFCHYRRFLDFPGLCGGRTRRTSYRRFQRTFALHYNERSILSRIADADIVMRQPSESGFPTVREQFVHAHPGNAEDFDRFVSLVRERDPDCSDVIDQTLASGRLAMELQFVMRRDIFCDFMEWAFSLCREFESRWRWSGPSDGPAARIPAFLVERLFLVWLAIRRKRRPLKVLELPLVKLTGRPWWYVLLKPLLPVLPKKANDRIYTRFK